MNQDNNKEKRRALGRGLEELFSIEDINYGNIEEKIMETVKEEEIKEIPLSELRVNPYQPRKTFDEESLNELAESIKEYGVFQPIIVKKSIKGYEIVAGERRYRASLIAKKDKIPAIIRNFTDEEMMEIAILENLQRENLNSIDEAEAYNSLMNNLNLTQEQVAKRVNKSRSHITNMIGLLVLPDNVKKLVAQNNISMGHARVLSKLEDQNMINDLADKIIKENLSVRELEELTNNDTTYERKNKITKQPKSKEYSDLERELSEYLGTKIKINNKKLIISYENDQDLNRILEIIKFNN